MMVTRSMLLATIVLTVLGTLGLILGLQIGQTGKSWEIVLARPGAPPLGQSVIFIADVYHDQTLPLGRVDSLIRYEQMSEQSIPAAVSPDRRYLVQSLTSDQQRLVLFDRVSGASHVIGRAGGATWSPDSRYIAYALSGGRLEVMQVEDGMPGEPVSLLDDDLKLETYNLAGPGPLAWSPDSSRLAIQIIASADDTMDVDIYTVHPDGSELTNITDSDNMAEGYPAWSPDGTRIAYIGITDPMDGALYIMNADGSDTRPLVETLNAAWPVWSPDGMRIAYIGTLDGYYSVIVIDADGRSDPVALAPLGFPLRPVWSPDGDYVAYLVAPDAGINIVNVRSRRSRLLVRETHMMLP